MQCRKEVYKIVEYRDGAVYRTRKVKDIWLPVKSRSVQEEREIAKANGGDILVNTLDYRKD